LAVAIIWTKGRKDCSVKDYYWAGKVKVKGKVFPLQARFGPEGG